MKTGYCNYDNYSFPSGQVNFTIIGLEEWLFSISAYWIGGPYIIGSPICMIDKFKPGRVPFEYTVDSLHVAIGAISNIKLFGPNWLTPDEHELYIYWKAEKAKRTILDRERLNAIQLLLPRLSTEHTELKFEKSKFHDFVIYHYYDEGFQPTDEEDEAIYSRLCLCLPPTPPGMYHHHLKQVIWGPIRALIEREYAQWPNRT